MAEQDKVDLWINGEPVSGCAPSSLIVDVLRDDLGLLGTKKSCETGACGACTVLLDGCPVLSCRTFAGSASQRALTTIEGLVQDPESRRLIASFTSPDLPGCRDCTSGFIISAKALLQVDPAPDVTEIKRALAGHTCRCVGHEFFIEAVLKASGQTQTDSVPPQTDPPTEERFPCAQATSIRDIRLPRLAEAVVLGSRFAAATIVAIDAQAARLAPGVIAVLTATDADVDGALRLATTTTYVGEPIAVVIADSHQQATRALSRIEVAYETIAPAAAPGHRAPTRDPLDMASGQTTRALAGSGGAVASWREDRASLLTNVTPTDAERSALFAAAGPGLAEGRTEWTGLAPASAARRGLSRDDAIRAALLSKTLGRPVRVHPHAGSFGNTGNSSPPSVHIDHDAGATAFSRHQSMDAAARQRGMDPLAFRLQQIKDPVVANGLTRAATAFGWTEKWRGWAHDDIERRRPGIGLALTNEGTADAEGSTIAVFVDVDVDTELGTISLGDCTVLVITGSAPSSLLRLAAQTGLALGVETALVQDAVAVDDLDAAPATGHFLSRSMSTLDSPRAAYILRDSGAEAEFSFETVVRAVASATVGALVNAVRDATGVSPSALPMTADRLRWRNRP